MITFGSMTVENFGGIQRQVSVNLGQPGLTCVVGPNGAGKSSLIPDALTWVLFGETTKDGPADAVVNGKTGKDCHIEVEVSSLAGMTTVHRYRKHHQGRNGVELIQGGAPMKFEIRRAAQDWVSRLLGCDRLAFVSQVIFGQRLFQRFSLGTATEQTQILETHLGLGTLPLARDEIQEQARELAGRLAELRIEAQGWNVRVEEAMARVESMQRAQEASTSAIRDAEQRLAEIRTKFESVRAERESGVEPLAELEEHAVALRKIRDETLSEQRRIWLVIEAVQDRPVCPTCQQTISREARSSLGREYKQQTKSMKQTRIQLGKVEGTLAERKEQFHALGEALGDLQSQFDGVKAEVATLHRLAKVQDTTDKSAESLKNAQHRYQSLEAQIAGLESRNADYQFWMQGYGPKGVRADALARVIPQFNRLVNFWLSKWGLNQRVRLFWDEDGRIRLTVNGRAFAMASGGEKQRIDLAIVMALAGLGTGIGPEFRIRVYDDPFEGVDPAGQRMMMTTWKTQAEESSVFVLVPDESDLVREMADTVIHVQGGRCNGVV